MKILKYIYVGVVSLILLVPAFVIFLVRTFAKGIFQLFIELPLRKLVFWILELHEWLTGLAGMKVADPLNFPRIPKI